MPETNKPVRIAVNVMRARLTIIGFNIAIVSFQVILLNRLSGGISVPGLDHSVHIGADIALFMSMALSLVAMVAFLASSAFDEVGVCTHWSLVAGDLLMYLSLAHTASGFFAPLSTAIGNVASKLPGSAPEIFTLQVAVMVVGGVAWFLNVYVGPLVSLLRSPFPRRTNITLGFAYLVVLLGAAWVAAHASRLEAQGLVTDTGIAMRTLLELVQPFWW